MKILLAIVIIIFTLNLLCLLLYLPDPPGNQLQYSMTPRTTRYNITTVPCLYDEMEEELPLMKNYQFCEVLEPVMNAVPFYDTVYNDFHFEGELLKKIVDVQESSDRKKLFGCERCTCSVVGSSAALLGSGYGALIDQADIVIRMNRATVEGFEKDVGEKYTIQFTWEVYQKKNFDKDAFGWMNIGVDEPVLPAEYNVWMYPSYLEQFNETQLILNPLIFKYSEKLKCYQPRRRWSTGIVSVFLALSLCDEISIFGVDGYKCTDGKRKYFDTRKTCETNAQLSVATHFWPREVKFIQELTNCSNKIVQYP